MSDKNAGVLLIFDRLKFALRITEDAALATVMGMSKEALSNRKRRDSLPKQAIDQLIVQRGLSPDFIYDGVGSVLIEDEHGHTWQQGFTQRIAFVLSEYNMSWLVREGYAIKDLNKVVAGKLPPSLELLRDMRRHLAVDLHYLFTGDVGQSPSAVEEVMLKLYRSANAEAQQSALAALALAGLQNRQSISNRGTTS